MAERLAKLLRTGSIVLLHSANAAAHFANECSRMDVKRDQIRLACLGPRIADAAGNGWAEKTIAEQPNDSALLVLVKNMCK